MTNNELEIKIELYNRLKNYVDTLASEYGKERVLTGMREIAGEMAIQLDKVVYINKNNNLDYINGDNNPDGAA